MTVMARISREYLLQIFAFTVAVLDRLLIPALLIRTIGVSGFSGWTVALAMAAFVPVLDFGILRHFSNRMLVLRAQGQVEEALNVFRQGSILMFGVMLLAGLLLACWLVIHPPRSGDASIDAMIPQMLIPVLAALLLNQSICLRQALFRAHQQFAQETILLSASHLFRIALICGAALAGASLVTLGWIWFGAVLLGSILPSIILARQRFQAFDWRWPEFRPGDIIDVVRSAPGFWLASLSLTAFAAVPLLVLGYWAAGAAAMAQFVLMRTIANLVRQIMQLFANVFGLELARRYALQDEEGFAKVFVESNRVLGTQSAVAAVVLLVIGRELFALWTGQQGLYATSMLALAILPPILLPGMILSIETLGYAGRQWTLVLLRLVQAMVTCILLFILPIDDIGLRMMAALAAGEILGLGVPLLWAMRSVDQRLTVARQLSEVLWVGGVLALSALILWPVQFVPNDEPYLRLIAGAFLGMFALVVCLLLFGLSPARRSMLLEALKQRTFRG